jgi:glycosyltransferase involved in cell wall biosynthesis
MQPPSPINFSVQRQPTFSCLCVTDGRTPFTPWLLWNYRKQDLPSRELVVVDGGDEDGRERAWPGDVRVARCPPGTSVGAKRNLAVAAARGSLIAWFDDDDWQHPRRLSVLATALAGGAPVAGAARSWFVRLADGRAREHSAARGVVFNGLGVRRAALARVAFDERRARAADSAWMAALRRELRSSPVVVPEHLSFWLCHRRNLSNPASRRSFGQPLAAVREAVGGSAWGDTDAELARLRDRLG